MIFELKKSDFHKCMKMLNEQGQVEAKAVIALANPGRIFVDSPENPQSGLVWLGNNDGFIFIGKEDNEPFNSKLNDLIDHVIVPDAKKIGLGCFEGLSNHHKWDQVIEDLFAHRELRSWRQRVYRLREEQYKQDSTPEIEPGYTIVKMNKALYENHNNSISNIEFLRSKILEFWSTPDSFFDRGIGYGVIHGKQIVSVCFSGFVAEGVHCIDIETLEAHRGKKIGAHGCSSFRAGLLCESSDSVLGLYGGQ